MAGSPSIRRTQRNILALRKTVGSPDAIATTLRQLVPAKAGGEHQAGEARRDSRVMRDGKFGCWRLPVHVDILLPRTDNCCRTGHYQQCNPHHRRKPEIQRTLASSRRRRLHGSGSPDDPRHRHQLWQATHLHLHGRAMTTVEALEAEARQLAPTDLSRLLERLVASLDADPAVEAEGGGAGRSTPSRTGFKDGPVGRLRRSSCPP